LSGNGVIHIGFLSSTEVLSPSRNSFRLSIRRHFGLWLSAVLQRDIHLSKRPRHMVPFRSCEVRWSSVSSPPAAIPAALSCSHPSGSGPRARVLSHTSRAPSRFRRDQNDVSLSHASEEGMLNGLCAFVAPCENLIAVRRPETAVFRRRDSTPGGSVKRSLMRVFDAREQTRAVCEICRFAPRALRRQTLNTELQSLIACVSSGESRDEFTKSG
jgi:hypothetical protein